MGGGIQPLSTKMQCNMCIVLDPPAASWQAEHGARQQPSQKCSLLESREGAGLEPGCWYAVGEGSPCRDAQALQGLQLGQLREECTRNRVVVIPGCVTAGVVHKQRRHAPGGVALHPPPLAVMPAGAG